MNNKLLQEKSLLFFDNNKQLSKDELNIFFLNVNKIVTNNFKKIKFKSENNFDMFSCVPEEINTLVSKDKVIAMKKGLILQEIIGAYPDYLDLKVGDKSGLDIRCDLDDKKFIMELKMRTNTDNASSRKTNFEKLSKFCQDNKDYIPIYGTLNENTKEKTKKGSVKKFNINGITIYQLTGYKLLKFLFGKDYKKVLKYIQKQLKKHFNL